MIVYQKPKQGNKKGSKKAKSNPKKKSNQSSGGKVQVAPAAASKLQVTQSPKFSDRGRDSILVEKRELILPNVAGSTTFAIGAEFPLNPGMPTTFPWLSQVAQNYEQYRFEELEFQFISRSPSNTKGSVTLAVDYDASDDAPTTEIEMSDFQGTVEGCPWQNLSLRCDRAALNAFPKRYVRNTAVGDDIKTFDSGNFYIASNDCADTTALGKLWVRYKVRLFVPTYLNALGSVAPQANKCALFTFDTNNNQYSHTGNSAYRFGFPTVVANPFGIGYNPTSKAFQLPKGNWLVKAVVGFLANLYGPDFALQIQSGDTNTSNVNAIQVMDSPSPNAWPSSFSLFNEGIVFSDGASNSYMGIYGSQANLGVTNYAGQYDGTYGNVCITPV